MVYVVTESFTLDAADLHCGGLLYGEVTSLNVDKVCPNDEKVSPIVTSTLAHRGLAECCTDAPNSTNHVPGYFGTLHEGPGVVQTGFKFGLGDGFAATFRST